MKGVSTALVIVVAIIVLLVVVVVVLGIFTRGTATISPYFELKGICQQQGASMCGLSGQLPPTWGVETQTDQGPQSCKTILKCNDCVACGFAEAPAKPGEGWR